MSFATIDQWWILGGPGVLTVPTKTAEYNIFSDHNYYIVVRHTEGRSIEYRSVRLQTLLDVLGLDGTNHGSWGSITPRWRDWRMEKMALAKSASRAEKFTGMMAAFFLSPEDARALALPNGEPPEDMHITLAFLGDSQEHREAGHDFDRLMTGMRQFAEASPALMRGKIGGYGRFTATPEGVTHPVIALPDLPSLPTWRQKLCDKLLELGFPANNEHGYTPHITLAYIDPFAPMPISSVPNLELQFNHLALAIGDERYIYPLGTR